jgi:cyclopropane fatty-acyl-phospholipid synthase-like methyltransferase
MKPETTEDILELLSSYIISASLGAAMELGLFWMLDEKPLAAPDVAGALNVPLNRCHHWLQILCKYGLLEENAEGYTPSVIAQKAILDALSRATWAFQAREERDSSLSVRDLALNISQPMCSWQPRSMTPSDKLHQEQVDPSYVERFTRKLYEIHISLADEVANMLDLRGVKSLLDLGGGSGVVSLALLRKSRELISVVVDFENVCQVGREIASENGLEKRIRYLAADFLEDDLPAGFDMVMLCDVGSHGEMLFRKIYDVLSPGGRLVIVDKFAPSRTNAPPSRLPSAFLYSLEYPSQSIGFTTVEMVQTRLHRVGFRSFSFVSLPHKDNLPWNVDWSMLEAKRQMNLA